MNYEIEKVTSLRAMPLRGRDVPLHDELPATAQQYDVAVSKLEKYLRVGQPPETVHKVKAATRCAVFVLNRFIIHHIQPRAWIVWLVWWLIRSRYTNGSSVSPSERKFHFSSRKSSSVKCRFLSKMTVGPVQRRMGTVLLRATKMRVRLLWRLTTTRSCSYSCWSSVEPWC